VTQRPTVLRKFYAKIKLLEKENLWKNKRKKQKQKKENLYLKTPKDAANSQFFSSIEYSQSYPVIITHFR
jgi:hypothetical protein